MAGGASEVKETTLSKDEDTVSIGELPAIELRLNILLLDTRVVLETLHVDLIIEVTDVTNNSIVLHLSHMRGHNDVLVSGGGDEDVGLLDDSLDSLDLITFHTGLKSTDWITFCDDYARSACFHGCCASFTDITKSTNNNLFTSKHNISSSHETIR